MPGAEAFLEAILAEPEADGPRLAFADWLDERGDHLRAEFIRVQIALARMREDDPRWPPLARRGPALERRERELIDAVRDRWLREYAQRAAAPSTAASEEPFSAWIRRVGIGSPPEGAREPFSAWLLSSGRPSATFERGMLEWVKMSGGVFCRQLNVLFRDWPVRHLWLSNLAGHVATLADRPWPGRVTKLIVSWTTFQRGDLVRFLGSPNLADLRELTLGSGVAIDPDEVAGLVGLKLDRLESLRVTGGRRRLPGDGAPTFDPAGVAALAGWPQMSRLAQLEMEYQELGSAGVEVLCAPGRLESLTQLGLADNDITASGAGAVARSAFFGALEVLDLSHNPLGDEGIARVARGPHRGRLRGLDLTATNCGPAGIEELLRLVNLEALTALKLSSNALGAEGATALARAPALAGLQTLELSHAGIGAGGTRALAASPYLGKLRSLDLSGNEFDLWGNELREAGVRALIDSANLASLRSLNLAGTGLGDEAARALARWPGLARLKYLGLSQNRIGDAGAEALANSPYTAGVGSLDLSFNSGITERGKAAFAAAGLSNVAFQQVWMGRR